MVCVLANGSVFSGIIWATGVFFVFFGSRGGLCLLPRDRELDAVTTHNLTERRDELHRQPTKGLTHPSFTHIYM